MKIILPLLFVFRLCAEPLFVSLGSHCEPAVHIKENDLRRAAFPFDWLLTLDHDHFCKILDEDFAELLNENYFIQHPIHPLVLENTYYEVEFRHDWPSIEINDPQQQYQQQMEEVQTKYRRRIERFRQLDYYQDHVFFLRAAYDFNNDPQVYWGQRSQAQIGKEQAIEIKKHLDQFFPHLDFTLVILNYSDENVPKISGIDRVIEFKIRKDQKQEDYKRVFQILQNLHAFNWNLHLRNER